MLVKVKDLPSLKKEIAAAIRISHQTELPKEFELEEGNHTYKITVELMDDNFFIDSLGRKWYRSPHE